MSISGHLVDVSIADVMQFVHLGGRTGTLVIESKGRRAEVGFHRGRIISAWTPQTRRLGDLLLEAGIVDDSVLQETLVRQQTDVPRVSFGKILVSLGAVTKDQLRDVVTQQIEETIYDLVSWRDGRFDFALDELRPVDDIALYPGDILPDINLNTQMVVLEALRIFDEKNREKLANHEDTTDGPAPLDHFSSLDESPRPEGLGIADDDDPIRAVTREMELSLPQRLIEEAEEAARISDDQNVIRVQVVTHDETLIENLTASLPEGTELVRAKLWDAGLTLPGQSPPVVVVDMRRADVGIEALASLRRARAYASIIAVAEPEISVETVYSAGALAVLPPDGEAVASCVENVLRNRRGREGLVDEIAGTSAGFAKLRRVVADLRSGLLSATVALNLMQVISESVDRAIMFLVRGGTLEALGAFGFNTDGESLAAITQGQVLDLDRRSVLARAVEDGQARSVRFEDTNLPDSLARRIGRPRTGQVVVFPVLGSDRVNSVVYTDNGSLSREIEEIEILELAAAQVGVAFENEILRRQMDQLAQ